MRGLVVSGGGCKGAYEAGALQRWMIDDGISYDIYCGTSVGAINAAFLAQTPKAPKGHPGDAARSLLQLWNRVNNSNIKKNWFPLGVLEAVFKTSVYDSSPVQKWISSELNTAAIAKSGNLLRIVSASYDLGQVNVATETTPDLDKWVIASSAFPIMLTPYIKDDKAWTDGGVYNVTPLGEAIKAGATEIDVIMCSDPFGASPWISKGKKAIPGFLVRVIDMMNTELSRRDLQICGLKNDLADIAPQYKNVKLRILEPKVSLIDNSLDFDPAKIQAMIQQGYADAKDLVLQPAPDMLRSR